jgi:hypothetical protein
MSLIAAMATGVAAADPPPPGGPGTSTGDGPLQNNSGDEDGGSVDPPPSDDEGDGHPDGWSDQNDNGINDADEEPPGDGEGKPAPRVAAPRSGGGASRVSPVHRRPHSTVSAQTLVIRRDSTTPPAVEPPSIVRSAPAGNPAPRVEEQPVRVEPAQRVELPVVPKVLRSPFSVDLSETTINPGGHVMATGFGCGPAAPVTVTFGQSPLGATVADQQGTFAVALATDSLGIGHHDVKADCGQTKEVALDVVLVSRVGTGAATTTLILIFMVSGVWYFGHRILSPTELRSRNV